MVKAEEDVPGSYRTKHSKSVSKLEISEMVFACEIEGDTVELPPGATPALPTLIRENDKSTAASTVLMPMR